MADNGWKIGEETGFWHGSSGDFPHFKYSKILKRIRSSRFFANFLVVCCAYDKTYYLLSFDASLSIQLIKMADKIGHCKDRGAFLTSNF